MSSNFLSTAKSFASKFYRDRSSTINIQMQSEVDVKFYVSQTLSYAALFAIVSMGTGPSSMQIINIYGNFDHEKIGGSTNLPPEMLQSSPSSNVSVITNPLIKQFIAYKEDAAGKIYFSNSTNSPPSCDKFNYCFMIFGDNSGSFGIKSSDWKVGDKDVYSFKITDLLQIDMETFSNPSSWCKSLLPPPSNSNTVSTSYNKSPEWHLAVQIISGVFFLIFLIFVIYVIYKDRIRQQTITNLVL